MVGLVVVFEMVECFWLGSYVVYMLVLNGGVVCSFFGVCVVVVLMEFGYFDMVIVFGGNLV